MSVLGLETIPAFPAKFKVCEPTIDGVELDEYIRVCDEIGGLSCADLALARLRKHLREENAEPFERKQVTAYLDQKLGKEWQWFGLRQEDADHLGGWVLHTEGARDVEFAKTQYMKAVPYPVLLTIEKIRKAIPDVYFFVSAPEVPEGDPFLLVTRRGMGGYIIECWDEPSFRRK